MTSSPTPGYFSRYGRGIVTTLVCGAALLLAVLSLLIAHFTVPAFAELFQSFGSDLPVLTRIVFAYGKLIALLLVVLVLAGGVNVLLSRQQEKAQQDQAFYLACVLLVLTFLWVGLIGVACYAPIWAIGAVV